MGRFARAAGVAVWMVGAAGCLDPADDLFCDAAGCDLTREEWARIASLAGAPEPPPDPSNKYFANPAAAKLGQRFFFDTRFSGALTGRDAIGRTVPVAGRDAASPVACASCHDIARGGADTQSFLGNVSVGTGWM